MADTFASFFKSKVVNLRSGHTPIENISRIMNDLKESRQIQLFTVEEIEKALKYFKGS